MPYSLIIYIALYVVWFAFVLYKNRLAVLLLPLFFPLYLLRFDLFGVPVYFIEGLIILAAIPIFLKIFKGDENIHANLLKKFISAVNIKLTPKKKALIDFLKSPFFPISLFLVACFISALIVPDEFYKQALGILKSWIIIPLIFFIIYYYTVKTTRDISIAMYSYMTSSLILGIWALYQAVSGNFITIDQRASGPFESANYLALYISPALVFAAVGFIQTFIHEKIQTAEAKWTSIEHRIYYLGVVSVLFAVLILTQSYGGVIGVFGALFIYIIYERIRVKEKRSRSFLNKLIGFAVLLLILGGGITAALNIEKFQNLTRLDEHTSVATRIEIWTVGLNLIKENPLLGTGLGQYENQYVENAEKILGKIPYEEKRLHSHNIYMSFWINSGILGLISFIWIVILAYFRILKFKSQYRNVITACLVMLTYILIHGLIDVPFWKNDLALIFWLILGSIFALSTNKTKWIE